MIDPSTPPGPGGECLAGPPTLLRCGADGRCALVVALSYAGLSRARSEGLRDITAIALMRSGLADADAASAVLRFVAQPAIRLPSRVDRLANLDALLGRDDPRDPPVVSTSGTGGNAVRQLLHVPGDLCWFTGHFPGEPILAGVVQLRWAVGAARTLMGMADGPAAIRQIKFKSPIRPASLLELTLTRLEGAAAVGFTFRSAGGEHSSGRLQY